MNTETLKIKNGICPHKHTYIHTYIQTDRQTYRHTYRHTNALNPSMIHMHEARAMHMSCHSNNMSKQAGEGGLFRAGKMYLRIKTIQNKTGRLTYNSFNRNIFFGYSNLFTVTGMHGTTRFNVIWWERAKSRKRKRERRKERKRKVKEHMGKSFNFNCLTRCVFETTSRAMKEVRTSNVR